MNLRAEFNNKYLDIESEGRLVFRASRRGVHYLDRMLGSGRYYTLNLASEIYKFLDAVIKGAKKVAVKSVSCDGLRFKFSNPPIEGSLEGVVRMGKRIVFGRRCELDAGKVKFFDELSQEDARKLVKRLLTENGLTVYSEDARWEVNGKELKLVANGRVVLRADMRDYEFNYPFFVADEVELEPIFVWFENVLKDDDKDRLMSVVRDECDIWRKGFYFKKNLKTNKSYWSYESRDSDKEWKKLRIKVEDGIIEMKGAREENLVFNVRMKCDRKVLDDASEKLANYILWLDRHLKF